MRKFEDILSRGLEMVLVVFLLTIAAIVVMLVVLRYAFSSSIAGANETVTILFVYTTAVGAAVAIGKREHISIPLAVEALPPRGQTIVHRVELILVAILNAMMFWYSIGWIRITGNYLMPSTGLPRAVVQASVPLGCALAVVYCLLRLITPSDTQRELVEQEARRDRDRRGGK